MNPEKRVLIIVVIILLVIAVLAAVMAFAPIHLRHREAVHCSDQPLNATVWRCQGFFDQLENPMVWYENGRWSLEDAETVNRPIRFTEEGCNTLPSRTIEYTPNVSIDGQNISFDLLVSNPTGTYLAEVPYTVETRVEPRTASWDGEYPWRDALVAEENGTIYDFPAGGIREVRVHARLAAPQENQSLKELFVVVPGPEAKAGDGSVIRQDRISEGNLMIFIQSPDTVIRDPTPVRTLRPLTDAPGAPAWVEDDRRIVQEFLKNPDAVVVYERNETFDTVGSYHLYRTDEGEIYVNDQSRRVDRAGFYESVAPARKVLIPQDKAESLARSYAAEHYPGFSTRNMVMADAKLLDHGDMGKEYSFGWQEQVFGVANGNFVMICLSPEDGEILTYLSRDRTAPEIAEPTVGKEQAIRTAVKNFTDVYNLSSTDGLEVSAKASVVPFLQDRVMWIVNLHIDLPDDLRGHRGGEVYVDASTGEVAYFNPCQ